MTGEPTCRWRSDEEAIANLRSDIKEINDLCLATIGTQPTPKMSRTRYCWDAFRWRFVGLWWVFRWLFRGASLADWNPYVTRWLAAKTLYRMAHDLVMLRHIMDRIAGEA